MKILGIETSCDETAVSIIEPSLRGFLVRAHISASQIPIHKKYGGVVPEVAAREHALTIIPTIQFALKKARLTLHAVDCLAVTAGPGLITALVVGVETAKAIAFALDKPVIGINHIEGHVYSNWPIRTKEYQQSVEPKFPALALIVSGGHTELILMTGHGQYKLLGATRDDAAGEVIDKVAKLLGLGYPGGPAIQSYAEKGNAKSFGLPRPMLNSQNFEFSFAGLKTAVLYLLQDYKPSAIRRKQFIADVCASFQQAVVDVLVTKTVRAAQQYRVKSVLLAGGVAANELLRKTLGMEIKRYLPHTTYHVPPLALCTDNATMIAMAATFHAKRNDFTPWKKLKADPNWEIGR